MRWHWSCSLSQHLILGCSVWSSNVAFVRTYKVPKCCIFLGDIRNVFLMFYLFWERERQTERERRRIPSRVYAIRTELDTGLDLMNLEIMTWVETKSRTLNWLSHPCIPEKYQFCPKFIPSSHPLSLALKAIFMDGKGIASKSCSLPPVSYSV